jgi:hypothetical protein
MRKWFVSTSALLSVGNKLSWLIVTRVSIPPLVLPVLLRCHAEGCASEGELKIFLVAAAGAGAPVGLRQEYTRRGGDIAKLQLDLRIAQQQRFQKGDPLHQLVRDKAPPGEQAAPNFLKNLPPDFGRHR